MTHQVHSSVQTQEKGRRVSTQKAVYQRSQQHCSRWLKVETARMSIEWWMGNKIWYIRTVEYYSVIKRNEILIGTTAWMWKHYAKRRKPVTKDHTLNDSIYRNCSESDILQMKKAGQWCPGAGGKREWGITANGHGVSFGAMKHSEIR